MVCSQKFEICYNWLVKNPPLSRCQVFGALFLGLTLFGLSDLVASQAVASPTPQYLPGILDNLGLDLRYEETGQRTLGLDLSYALPWTGWEKFHVLAGYGSNRLFGLWAPALLPVDYGKIGIQYRWPLSAWIEPFGGFQLRLAGSQLNTQAFPELSQINSLSFATSLTGGCRVKIYPQLAGLVEINLNYPASFAIPYLSWSLGVSYKFGVKP